MTNRQGRASGARPSDSVVGGRLTDSTPGCRPDLPASLVSAFHPPPKERLALFHEIKLDGFRLMATRRDGARVRVLTRNGSTRTEGSRRIQVRSRAVRARLSALEEWRHRRLTLRMH
jgi:ATP-dependent DNA ligase